MRRLQLGIVFVVALVALGALPVREAAAQPTQKTPGAETLLEEGRFELGLGIAGLLSSDSASSDAEESSGSSNAFYGNPFLAVGYMLTDKLQLRGEFGGLFIDTEIDDTAVQNTSAFFSTVSALYHIPIRYGMGVYGGLGLGFYAGSTERELEALQADGTTVQTVTASNGTWGLGGQASLGLLFQPGSLIAIRAGLRFDGLFGWENPDESTGLEQVRTTNLKLLGFLGLSLRL